MIPFPPAGNLHADDGVQVVDALLVKVNNDGRVLIEFAILHTALQNIGSVKLQRFHYTLGNGGTLQNLQFVVETITGGDDTHLLQCIGVYVGVVALVVTRILDEHPHSCRINGWGIAQVNLCASKANEHGQYNPIPVEDDDVDDGAEVKPRGFLFLFYSILIVH